VQWLRRLVPATLVAFAAALATAASTTDWFSTYEPASLRIEAPLNELFAHAQQTTYSVRGTLSYAERGSNVHIDDVKVSIRGNTSRRESECTFPKLKLAWPSGSLKIGTHCGESADNSVTAKFGRLPNERSPWREAFVYRLLDVLKVPSLRARPARVTYVYTDAATGTTSGSEPLTRNALLLEDTGVARRRFGASKEIAMPQFTTARDAFSVEDTATLAFAEALVGNFDWCLRFYTGDTYRCDARRPLWNILAFAWPDGHMRPVMYDFDVAGMVAGMHRWFRDIFNEASVPSRSHAEVEVIAQLQRARTLFDRATLDATRRRFADRKRDAYALLETATLDADGRRAIQSYLDPFFAAMESDAAFYRPVVTAENTLAYADADRAMPLCSARGPVPVGTPVGEPVATRGSMVQVVLLDALWTYAPPVQCPVFRKSAVWIDKSAISANFPQ
jgi:hypothetical protein